jgi:hypothetical protein
MSKVTTASTLYKEKAPQRGLPPIVGMIGSIIFFLVLFALADPNQEGYDQFRKCHGNCVNGILHFLGMPLAVSGVFLIVRSVSDHSDFTRSLSFLVTTTYLYLYLRFETHPYTPWLFYIMYMSIWEFILYRKVYNDPSWGRLSLLVMGIFLVLINVGALETIGHGLFEHHHSYVREFFNVSTDYIVFYGICGSVYLLDGISNVTFSLQSVFHTPLYGVNSVLATISPRPDHTCW